MRVTFVVEIDIERSSSTRTLCDRVADGIKKALSPKKLNHGEVCVYARPADAVETAALNLAQTILAQAEEVADQRADYVMESHTERYNHSYD